MLLIRFDGRLGNQMFQYAAARLAAERLGCSLVVEEGRTDLTGALRQVVTAKSRYPLFDVFDHLRPGRAGAAIAALRQVHPRIGNAIVEKLLFPGAFAPERRANSDMNIDELYDPRYFDIRPWTRLSGFFQSERYFAGHEERVRGWFAPTAADTGRVTAEWGRAGIDPDDVTAIHVRLGDYRHIVSAASAGGLGWSLPASYYHAALDAMGSPKALAVFSDEPELAAVMLGRPCTYISSGNDTRLDFFMMASCKRIITANSTYSWWAAWLGNPSEKVVVAPKYFVGRNLGRWYPANIQVDRWTYV